MVNFKEDERLNTLNHSCAHLMAQAIKHLYPQAKFWVGPVVAEGFYYDIDLGDDVVRDEDIENIEKEILKIFPRRGKDQIIRFNSINVVFDQKNNGLPNANGEIIEGIQREYFTNDGGSKLILTNKFIIFEINKYVSFDCEELGISEKVRYAVLREILDSAANEDELRSARERALDLLSAAEQTSGTLRQKLLRWYGEEAVEAAVLRMEELGLINDLDYGRRYAADAVNLRGWPRRRIAMELQKKGVPAEVIEEALADITEETEIETACRLLEGPYRGKLRDRKERDKVKAALQRRGFSYEVIRQAVSRAMEALPEGGETPEPEETPETGDGQEELLALIRKKYAKNMADRAGMEKTIAALYRRGYPLEEIKAAMNTILEQEENCRDD